jgi:hypothetical protein
MLGQPMSNSIFLTLWRHRSLVLELIKREFSGRYRVSFGGIVWSFAQPLFLLTVYTIAFGVILKARWSFSGSTTDYALMLFAGLIDFNASGSLPAVVSSSALRPSGNLIVLGSLPADQLSSPVNLVNALETAGVGALIIDQFLIQKNQGLQGCPELRDAFLKRGWQQLAYSVKDGGHCIAAYAK